MPLHPPKSVSQDLRECSSIARSSAPILAAAPSMRRASRSPVACWPHTIPQGVSGNQSSSQHPWLHAPILPLNSPTLCGAQPRHRAAVVSNWRPASWPGPVQTAFAPTKLLAQLSPPPTWVVQRKVMYWLLWLRLSQGSQYAYLWQERGH